MPIGDGELGGKPSAEPLLNLPGALDTVSPTLGFKIKSSDTFPVSLFLHLPSSEGHRAMRQPSRISASWAEKGNWVPAFPMKSG